MTEPTHPVTEGLDPAVEAWVVAVAGTGDVSISRRIGGASRAGYAVDVVRPDGTTLAWWLRTDPGFGPQSATRYTLHREAAVYRALGPTPVKAARLVAVHPELPAFLLQRVPGQSRFAQIHDRDAQVAIADAFMEQLAVLHLLDPADLGLPELGPVGSVADHVRDEIGEWERQYMAAGGGVPAVSVALAWLRDHVPPDGDHRAVLVQGDTGPGNFIFEDDRMVAITDWELAHWGDPHDDLAWILVRETLERLPDLDAAFAVYERACGRPVDLDRLRYFRVLAQCRCTIGTLAGLRSRDARGEIAWQLIYNTVHTRLLAESLAEELGIDLPVPLEVDEDPGPATWVYDVVLADLRDVVVPALRDERPAGVAGSAGFAATRTKGAARLVKYLRELDRLGPRFEAEERDELSAVLGHRVTDVAEGRAALVAAVEAGRLDAAAVVPYCLDQSGRETALLRSALGGLADRHLAFLTDPTR